MASLLWFLMTNVYFYHHKPTFFHKHHLRAQLTLIIVFVCAVCCLVGWVIISIMILTIFYCSPNAQNVIMMVGAVSRVVAAHIFFFQFLFLFFVCGKFGATHYPQHSRIYISWNWPLSVGNFLLQRWSAGVQLIVSFNMVNLCKIAPFEILWTRLSQIRMVCERCGK